MKLKVHPFGDGKTLVFVNDIDQCYRVKLFLEQFGIRSCVLNAELPLKSRHHIVHEFNQGVYDIIIATDQSDAVRKEVDSEEEEEAAETDAKPKHLKKRKGKADSEFGVSRGSLCV